MKTRLFLILLIGTSLLFSCSKDDMLTGHWRITEFGGTSEDPAHPNYYLDFANNKTFVMQTSNGSGNLSTQYAGNWQIMGSNVLKLTWGSYDAYHQYTIDDLTPSSIRLSGGIGNTLFIASSEITSMEKQ